MTVRGETWPQMPWQHFIFEGCAETTAVYWRPTWVVPYSQLTCTSVFWRSID